MVLNEKESREAFLIHTAAGQNNNKENKVQKI